MRKKDLEFNDFSNRPLMAGFWDGLRPDRIMDVDEWADEHRFLSSAASAEPGRWRTSRTPYLREILKKLSSHDPVQQVVWKKSAQIGATEGGNNWIGYCIDAAPGPILMVMPTDETVKRNSKIRITPMIESTPKLKEKVAVAKSRDSSNTIMQKDFPGGTLIMTGANSAVGLRSMPIRYLMLDEVDGYPVDLDGEGSPIELAKARTRTFPKRKIFMLSTPTVYGVSVIEAEFENTDQRRYFVPCPHCGVMQFLKWEQLRWEVGKPETVRYQCEACEELIEERFKTQMLNDGEWRATMPENASKIKVGYHLNSLYSPQGWFSWSDAVQQFEDIKNDVTKEKTFTNTVLGEVFRETGDSPEWEILYGRRETYKQNSIREEIAFLTAGVDIQKDRIEVEIVGWGVNKISYSVDYRVISGRTDTEEPWKELAKLFEEKWTSEDGQYSLKLRMMAVDTGYNTSHVYTFCRRHDFTKVIPVKGVEKMATAIGQPSTVDHRVDGKKIGTVKLWKIGVSVLKSEIYGYLKQQVNEDGSEPAGFCHFPQYETQYFRGLTAEQLLLKINKRGYREFEWVKKYERNEPLDCRVYAKAAATVIGYDRWTDESILKMIEKNKISETDIKKPVKKKGSGFWDR